MIFNIILIIIFLAIDGMIEYVTIHVLKVKCLFRGLAVPIQQFLTFCKTHQMKYLLLFVCDVINIVFLCIVVYRILTTQ